jgi:hypothetical protein
MAYSIASRESHLSLRRSEHSAVSFYQFMHAGFVQRVPENYLVTGEHRHAEFLLQSPFSRQELDNLFPAIRKLSSISPTRIDSVG